MVNKEELLKKLRFGLRKEDRKMLLILTVFFFVVFSYNFYTILKKPEGVNLFGTSIAVFLIKFLLLSNFISIISLEKSDKYVYQFTLIPFIVAEILFFLDFRMFGWIKSLININLNFMTIPSLIAIIILIAFWFYLRRGNTFEKSDPRNIYALSIVSIIFMSFVIVLMMYSAKDSSYVRIFFVKDTFFLLFAFISYMSFFHKSKKLIDDIKDLSEEHTPIKHGDFVYFRGKYNLLKEFSESKIFLIYNYTEKIFLYSIQKDEKKYDIYIKDSRSNPFTNPIILPGNEVEIFGKYLKIEKDGKQIDFIYPSRINNFGYPERDPFGGWWEEIPYLKDIYNYLKDKIKLIGERCTRDSWILFRQLKYPECEITSTSHS